MLGPVLERLHNELLNPLIDIAFDYMMEAGLLPPPPPELQGQALNIELVSMLAQAQRAIAINGVDRLVTHIGNLAALTQDPSVWDKYDKDQSVDNYADMLGVDPRLIVPEDKVETLRRARAKLQQAQMRSAALNQAADTAQKAGNTPTQGGTSTALDDFTNLFSQGFGAPQPQGA